VKARDISIFVCGHMVWRGLEAAETLKREDGVEAEVVNVSILKPIDSEAVLESLAKTGVGVTAEEHRVVGGLGDAIRQVAAEQHPVPIFALGMEDEFGSPAPRRPAWSTSASPPPASPIGPARLCSSSRSCPTRRFTAASGLRRRPGRLKTRIVGGRRLIR